MITNWKQLLLGPPPKVRKSPRVDIDPFAPGPAYYTKETIVCPVCRSCIDFIDEEAKTKFIENNGMCPRCGNTQWMIHGLRQ